jgi:hypothetical protein
MRRNKGGMQRRPVDVGGKKPLHGAVATRALAGNIGHGDGMWCTKRVGNDGAQLTERSGAVDLTKRVKECEDIDGFSLVFGG